MCRFLAYLGDPIPLDTLLLKPVNSLVHQSIDAREFRLRVNGDGFGVAWYARDDGAEPALFRSVTPAWSNVNLRHIARVVESRCVLAHVRAASPGLPVVETNCHPFVRRGYAFAHNGGIGGFGGVRRRLRGDLSDEVYGGLEGTTDSELLFALFLDRVKERGAGAEAMAAALADTVHHVVAAAKEPSYLNLVVTDGRECAATRFSTDPEGHTSSLHVHHGMRYVCEGDRCRMVEPGTGGRTALVSSERLSDDEGWRTVPRNHLVLVKEDRSVELRPLPAA